MSDWENNKMNPWVCTMTPHEQRRVGKTIEELGELLAVCGRLQIQAIDDIDPSSGKTNRVRFLEELADVKAQIGLNIEAFAMDQDAIARRVKRKTEQMHEWEAHYTD